MPKFHKTKAGRIEPCGAAVRACPLGEASHFDSITAAMRGAVVKKPHIDTNGNEGDWIHLGPEDRKIYADILERTDWSDDGSGRGTSWDTGEPIDDEGQHHYFGCLWAGLDAIQDVIEDEGEFSNVAPWQEPIRAEELESLKKALAEVQARSENGLTR